ncbi:MAG: branched-chain amino acid ABC transporter substrate-binding protein [Shinella sp.]|jgi:branched-chain amino acid transport system substrate-binding protein|nr:branched-chain amino acid ABC transporter substrate-binding protein [Shinella sp.]
MTRLAITTLLSAMFLAAASAAAAPLKIAVVAPTEGPLAILGRQILDGARFAAASNGAEIVAVPETCEEGGGKEWVQDAIGAGVQAAIGFLCTESLENALSRMAAAGIPAITLSVRSRILMEDALKKNWPLFRLAPAPDAEAEKAAEIIIRDWKAEPFALIDDGTIHARELVEALRLRLEEVGMKPAFLDTFRPAQEQQLSLVRRLARTGATHVFVGGDRNDTAIIARDARAEGLALSFLGGESLMAADQQVAMPDGVRTIAPPPYDLLAPGRATAQAMEEKGLAPEGYVMPAYAAVSLLEQAAAQAGGRPLPDAILSGSFSTIIGSVAFGTDHELRDNPYKLLEWRDGRFVPVDTTPESE